MPLLSAKPTQIPDEHLTGCECVQCTAERHLTDDDWQIVAFYDLVRDQVVNLNPMGEEAWIVLRLEAVESACRLYRVPPDERVPLVESVRELFECVQGRNRLALQLAYSTPAQELTAMPPPGDA